MTTGIERLYAWMATNPERAKQSKRRTRRRESARYRSKLRADAFAAYGGARCAHCGETDDGELQLDHIFENGAERRRQGEPTGGKLYLLLRQQGYPAGFQVLCGTCNRKKHLTHKRAMQRAA